MQKVEASGYSLNQILTIASLIEKETDGTDRENIASVIYNRLNNVGETYHKLQIDASLIYGLGDNYTGTLTSSDLNYNTPYNLSMYEAYRPRPSRTPVSPPSRRRSNRRRRTTTLRARQGRRAPLLQDLRGARELRQLQPVRRLT